MASPAIKLLAVFIRHRLVLAANLSIFFAAESGLFATLFMSDGEFAARVDGIDNPLASSIAKRTPRIARWLLLGPQAAMYVLALATCLLRMVQSFEVDEFACVVDRA